MKLHSVTTEIGSALLADISDPLHSIEAPDGWGLVFWGRCDRASFGAIILSSKAKWIADYDMKSKAAIVMWPPDLAGKTMSIDTTCVDALCPTCGSTNCVSNGKDWRCKDCGKRWKKASKRIRKSTIDNASKALDSAIFEADAIESGQYPA